MLQREKALSSGTAFRFVALVTVFVVVVAGSVEAVVDSKDFSSTWEGIWWAVVTVTTVGYGDVYPRSVTGRAVAIVVMFVGIGFLSVLTATIASFFVKTDRGDEFEAMIASLDRLEVEMAAISNGSSPSAKEAPERRLRLLVIELPLGAVRAIIRDVRRLVDRQEGAPPASVLGREPVALSADQPKRDLNVCVVSTH
jgi:voltage-gated potassium channel